jgi:threonine dehydratase
VLKLELLQHTGSFKPRGAFANLLTHDTPPVGVVAASGGNHGAAVAFAANRLGKPATIFVPRTTPQAKQDRIVSYGARLQLAGDCYDDALEASRQWASDSGALEVHAYDQVETLLGQGTVGLEFEQQAPDLDTLLVAVGGGGLIGGIAAWYAGRVTMIGVEPAAAPTLADALRAGHPVDASAGGIAADSLRARRVGDLMFPVAQAYVNRVALVSDEAIVETQQRVWDVLRLRAGPRKLHTGWRRRNANGSSQSCQQCSTVFSPRPTHAPAKQNSEDGNRNICGCGDDEVGGLDGKWGAGRTDRVAANFSKETSQSGYDEHQIQKKNETREQRRQIAMRATDVHSRHDPATDGPRHEG